MRIPKFLFCPSFAHARKRKQLWQPNCRNYRDEERENMNCGNQVAKDEGKKKRDNTSITFLQQITGG